MEPVHAEKKSLSHHSSLNRLLHALSQSNMRHLLGVKHQLAHMDSASALLSNNMELDVWNTWENISKTNYLPYIPYNEKQISSAQLSMNSFLMRCNKKDKFEENVAATSTRKHDFLEDVMNSEQFIINVTPVMNEENLWGCFYNFPELYEDVYSPVEHVRSLSDVPEIVGGVLTRDVISACLTHLKRNPILGDYVFIKLDLSHKRLVNIEVLQHYRYLVYLDLSSNYLKDLSVLSNLLYLQFLCVSHNRLSTVLEYETPQWFLTEVNYQYNSVKNIRDLTMFWSITVLNLSHNNIKMISGLENLAYLRRLDLSFNHIQRFENLNGLRLTWLDLSYNNISSFEFSQATGLWTLLHLEYLNINENNLTSIKIFSGCTRLQQLHARNNRLGMLLELAVYMRQLRRLTVLDLRSNPICSSPGYKEVVINTFPLLLNLDSEKLDPIEQVNLKLDVAPDINMFASRRLHRLLYIEQLFRAHVSPYVPPADTTDLPMVIFVGEEGIGKGTLARRLASECSSNVELAIQHTTAQYHFYDHYKKIDRYKFDDMLLAGEFLTYTEKDGESYGLSREESFIKDGKVRVACMDLTSALMMNLRGQRPYLILTTCLDKVALMEKQKLRKEYLDRDRLHLSDTSIRVPIERSTLQVLVSGRILVTGILNEILLTLPEEKDHSEFLIESECSLLMDSDARRAVQDYSRGINMLEFLCSSSTSVQNPSNYRDVQNETSLCSLYKESQGTCEYASDLGNSFQGSKRSGALHKVTDKTSDMSRPKSFDFKGIYNAGSSKSSKSVTFTSQNADASAPIAPSLAGLCLDEIKAETDAKAKDNVTQTMSKRFPWAMMGHPPLGQTASTSSLDDGDLWLSFLVETGLLQASDPNLQPSDNTVPRHTTRVDDPEQILRQLAIYRTIPSQTFTTNIKDDYDVIHRNSPGLFCDTITMDDPEAAFAKAKKILKSIFESQKNLKPMFDIDYAKSSNDCPIVQNKIQEIANLIAQERFFF